MPSQVNRHIKAIVGSNVRAARESQSLTQRHLAERLQMEAMNVSRWERGVVMPSFSSLVALAGALDVTVEWLTTDHEKQAA